MLLDWITILTAAESAEKNIDDNKMLSRCKKAGQRDWSNGNWVAHKQTSPFLR